MKQWATRVVSVADMEADTSQENTQKAIETVLLQQRCALSEWLKRENDNKYLPEDIRKKCRAVEDAVQNGADMGILLAAWGGTGPADLNRNGIVDGADLGILLSNWKP